MEGGKKKEKMKPRLAQWQLGVWQCYEELQLLISELLHCWWQPCKLILKLTEGTKRGPTVYLKEGGQCKNYQWSRNGNGSLVFHSRAAGQVLGMQVPLETGVQKGKRIAEKEKDNSGRLRKENGWINATGEIGLLVIASPPWGLWEKPRG